MSERGGRQRKEAGLGCRPRGEAGSARDSGGRKVQEGKGATRGHRGTNEQHAVQHKCRRQVCTLCNTECASHPFLLTADRKGYSRMAFP